MGRSRPGCTLFGAVWLALACDYSVGSRDSLGGTEDEMGSTTKSDGAQQTPADEGDDGNQKTPVGEGDGGQTEPTGGVPAPVGSDTDLQMAALAQFYLADQNAFVPNMDDRYPAPLVPPDTAVQRDVEMCTIHARACYVFLVELLEQEIFVLTHADQDDMTSRAAWMHLFREDGSRVGIATAAVDAEGARWEPAPPWDE